MRGSSLAWRMRTPARAALKALAEAPLPPGVRRSPAPRMWT
ncbi:MAG TPA: hypothetical protein VNK89_09965 [Thermoflexus sp.]|nr:hypothetical protein [Thermoflexus sp.]